MPRTRTEILSRIRETVASLDPTAEVWLFGSRARGDAREDSDWDVLVLTDKNVDFKTRQNFVERIYKLELEIEEAISVKLYNTDTWRNIYSNSPFQKSISNDLVKIS